MLGARDHYKLLPPSLLVSLMAVHTQTSIHHFFIGANLVALKKKDGGVRPITMGCTLCRFIATCAGRHVREDMAAAMLVSRQLGYVVGAESVCHPCCLSHLHNLLPNERLLKLNLRNAFTCIRRDKILREIEDLVFELLPFVHSMYSVPSCLFWGGVIAC